MNMEDGSNVMNGFGRKSAPDIVSGLTSPWQEKLILKLGIVNEGDVVPLTDLEGRMEFDRRILSVLESERGS